MKEAILFIVQSIYIYVYALVGFISHSPLLVFTLLVSTWSNLILTPWSMYNLLINLLSRQSIPVSFRICINLVQFTRSHAFCSPWNMHTTRLRPKFVLNLLFPFALHTQIRNVRIALDAFAQPLFQLKSNKYNICRVCIYSTTCHIVTCGCPDL
jgi:hypothetical protein